MEHKVDNDDNSEPLNLTIKKKPVAVVAPSSVTDAGSKAFLSKYYDNEMSAYNNKYYDAAPEDLSAKQNNNVFNNNSDCLDLTVVSKYNKNEHLSHYMKDPITAFPHEQLKNYIEKNASDPSKASVYDKNIFNEEKRLYDHLKGQDTKTSNIFKEAYKMSENLYDSLSSKQMSTTEGLYSVINSLAEQKFLTALYMNSLLAQNLSYGFGVNYAGAGLLDQNLRNNQHTVLNNLMDRHKLSSQLFRDGDKSLNIESVIKNEVNSADVPTGKSGTSAEHAKRASVDQKNSTNDNKNNQDGANSVDKKKPHIKKPLNAFMLYMKEMRAKVVAECTLKESAAINQILGRRWHALGREEQAKYYELARRERQLHMQLYPDWSSRANATRGKKRKRKQDSNEGGNSMKKCRARYGLDQQSQWCKPCRRKKKCIRYMESGDSNDGNQSDDNLGSCGSVGDAHTPPEDDTESLNHSLSSPGGLSGLSSLTSPSMILPSPSTSLASPSVSLASPCMSLQSPLTPHDSSAFDCKLPPSSVAAGAVAMAAGMPPHLQHNHQPHRNPVGTNPHDINNPLSVNQLTGQCVKSSPVVVSEPPANVTATTKDSTRPVISVT